MDHNESSISNTIASDVIMSLHILGIIMIMIIPTFIISLSEFLNSYMEFTNLQKF